MKKLTVSGVIFFDAILDNSKISTVSGPIHYNGNGTIFFSSPGQSLYTGETLCSGGTLGVDCAASPASTNMPNWDPAANTLWFVFGDKCAGCQNDLNGADGAFQGGIYVVHSCHVHDGGILLAGPLICGSIDVDGTGTAAFTFPPVTMYESPVTTSTVQLNLGPQSG